MTSDTAHFRKRRPGGALLLATAITLTAVSLGGAWLLRHDGTGPTRTTRPAPPPASADGPREVLTGQERGGLAERHAAQEAHGRVDAPDRGSRPAAAGVSDQEAYAHWQAGQLAGDQTIYLVSSSEQADVLRQAIADGDAIRASLGIPPFAATILVVTASAAEHHGQALGDAHVFPVGLARSEPVVIDLRTPQ